MKLAKILLLLALVIGGAGYYLFKINPKLLTKIPYSDRVFQLDQAELSQFTESASQELKTLTERGKVVGEHAQSILGSSVEADKEQPPLHERAFEYGRYLYCQQVVKDFEKIR
jgi:hypothetical protein